MSRLAATLWPEWAWAVAHLNKNRENRMWWEERLRGQWLCIHGGASIGGEPMPKRCGAYPLAAHIEALDDVAAMADHAGCFVEARNRLTIETVLREGRGIVAVCKVPGYEVGNARGWYAGRPQFGWILENVITLPQPVPCRGAQRLWELPGDVEQQVREQVQRVRHSRQALPAPGGV